LIWPKAVARLGDARGRTVSNTRGPAKREEIMRVIIVAACLIGAPMASIAQPSEFVGEWLLWVEHGNRTRPAYGSLVFEQQGGALVAFVEGGPAEVRAVDGNRIEFAFDWSNLQDQVHINTLEGRLVDGVIEGRMRAEDGTDRGAWRATRAQDTERNLPPDPVDLTGVWGPPAIISKHSFALTAAGLEAEEAYDSTIDDPMLRCVSDGLIRMSHGPWHIEVIEVRGHLYILHEDLQEIRRVYMDGRSFPDEIGDAERAMGYSIGHWDGSTLVIETRGLKANLWDAGGMPYTSAAVVNERWSLDDSGQLHIEITLDDPANFERPVRMHLVRERPAEGFELGPYSCDPHGFYRGLEFEGRLEEYWGRSGNRL
jgi:hypothetical protein